MLPWTIKYIPKKSSDIIGQETQVKRLQDFVKDYKKEKKKAILIYGAPGCGKTSAVHAIAGEISLELIEINASDARNKDAILDRVGGALGQQSLFFSGKIILIDEIDGLSGTKDRGGLSEVAKQIDKSSFPIIMTANNPYDQKFKALRKKSELVEFNTLDYRAVKKVLKNICYKEKINYDDTALSALSRRAGGDLRGAITDLQVLAEHSKRLRPEDVDELSERRQTESMVNALVKVFKSTNPEIALRAFDDIEEDIDQIFLWVDANLPKEYTKAEDLARAYDTLSLADVFRGRIRRWNYWRYLSYIHQLLSAGIALSKDEKYKVFVKYMPTMRLLRIWQSNMKNAKKKAVAQKIADRTHTSEKRVMQDTLPYLRTIFLNNQEKANALADELDLQKEEIEWLKKK